MTDDITARLTATFHAVIDPSAEVRDDLTADDVEQWDSLAHVNFIFAVEEEFGIEFTQQELADHMANVGELRDLIARKSGAG